MGTTGIDGFRGILNGATQPRSDGGAAITPAEVRDAVRAIEPVPGARVDADDLAAAKAVFLSSTFDRHATDGAVDVAAQFLLRAGAATPAYEPGKLYSVPRHPLPEPPAGHAWDLRGVDRSKPANVFAMLTPVDDRPALGEIRSFPIGKLPAPPAGTGWDLRGLDPANRDHVLAKLVPA
jgi:hypothetical protein